MGASIVGLFQWNIWFWYPYFTVVEWNPIHHLISGKDMNVQNENTLQRYQNISFYRLILKWTIISLFGYWKGLEILEPIKIKSIRFFFSTFLYCCCVVIFVIAAICIYKYIYVFFFLHFINIDLLVSAITCDKCTSLYVNAHHGNIISSHCSSKISLSLFALLYDYWFIMPKRSGFLFATPCTYFDWF